VPGKTPWHVQEFVGRLGASLVTGTAGTASHSAFASFKELFQGAVDFEAGRHSLSMSWRSSFRGTGRGL